MSFKEEEIFKPYRLTEKEKIQLKSKINFLDIDICNKKWEIASIEILTKCVLPEEERHQLKSKLNFLKVDIDNEIEHVEVLKKLLKGHE